MMFRLPEKQSRVLLSIAKDGIVTAPNASEFVKRHNLVSASSVQVALKALIEKEFIIRSSNEHSVYDKFFEMWLNSNF